MGPGLLSTPCGVLDLFFSPLWDPLFYAHCLSPLILMSCSYLIAIQHRHPFCILESLLSDMPMGSRSKRSYASAPPRYLFVQIDAPQPPAPPLQQVLIAAAKEDNLDTTLEYVINARDVPEVASNAVVLVDAVVQTSRPPSAAASPSPIRGVQIEGFFLAFVDAEGIFPVFEAPRQPPSSPPAYVNSAPRTCRQPPTSLLTPNCHGQKSFGSYAQNSSLAKFLLFFETFAGVNVDRIMQHKCCSMQHPRHVFDGYPFLINLASKNTPIRSWPKDFVQAFLLISQLWSIKLLKNMSANYTS